jgi:hypothetical protein
MKNETKVNSKSIVNGIPAMIEKDHTKTLEQNQ